ncbi:hypothetical protein ACLB2K_072532 [Fragaria x ananassa]
MLLLNHYDGFSNITAIPLDFVWIWVKVLGLPPALLTEETVSLISKTIWRVKVSPIDVIELQFRYERLHGRCRKPKKKTISVHDFPEGNDVATRVYGVRRAREENEDVEARKKAKFSLRMVSFSLSLKQLGLEMNSAGVQLPGGVGVKKLGRPHGSRNKPKPDAPKDPKSSEMEDGEPTPIAED